MNRPPRAMGTFVTTSIWRSCQCSYGLILHCLGLSEAEVGADLADHLLQQDGDQAAQQGDQDADSGINLVRYFAGRAATRQPRVLPTGLDRHQRRHHRQALCRRPRGAATASVLRSGLDNLAIGEVRPAKTGVMNTLLTRAVVLREMQIFNDHISSVPPGSGASHPPRTRGPLQSACLEKAFPARVPRYRNSRPNRPTACRSGSVGPCGPGRPDVIQDRRVPRPREHAVR